MHKEEFSKHIALLHNITQKDAHDVIDIFTSSVILLSVRFRLGQDVIQEPVQP